MNAALLSTTLNSSFAERRMMSSVASRASLSSPGSSTMIWSSFWITVGSDTPFSSIRSRIRSTALVSAELLMPSEYLDETRMQYANSPSAGAQSRFST